MYLPVTGKIPRQRTRAEPHPARRPADGRTRREHPARIASRARVDLRWELVCAAAAAGAAGVLLAADTLRPGTVSTRITAWCASLLLLSVATLVVTGRHDRPRFGVDTMRVGSWYPLWFGLTFAATSFVWRGDVDTSGATISHSGVLSALMVLHVALLGWTVGYLVGPGASTTQAGTKLARLAAPGTNYRLRTPYVAWVLLGTSLLGHLLQLRSGRFGYVGDAAQLLTNPARSGQLVSRLVECGTFALVVAAVDYARDPSSSRRRTLLTIFAVQVVLGGLAAHKEEFVVALLVPAVVLGAAGRLPWRALLAGFVIFVVVVVPYVTSYRATVRTADTTLSTSQGFAAAPGVLERSFGDMSREGVEHSLERLGSRTRNVDMVAIVVMNAGHTTSFLSATDYVLAPVLGVVPRAVWPSKPVLDSGYRFARDYLGLNEGQYSSAAIPPPADLYHHGGLLVVAIGMIAIGAACRLVDRTVHPTLDLRLALLYVPLFLLLVKSESAVTSMIAALPVQVVVSVLVCRLAFRPESDTDDPLPLSRPDAQRTGRAPKSARPRPSRYSRLPS